MSQKFIDINNLKKVWEAIDKVYAKVFANFVSTDALQHQIDELKSNSVGKIEGDSYIDVEQSQFGGFQQINLSFKGVKTIDGESLIGKGDILTYHTVSNLNNLNSIKNGTTIYLNQDANIGNVSYPAGTYVKSNGQLVSINAPKVVDVDLSKYVKTVNGKSASNYAVTLNGDDIYASAEGPDDMELNDVVNKLDNKTINTALGHLLGNDTALKEEFNKVAYKDDVNAEFSKVAYKDELNYRNYVKGTTYAIKLDSDELGNYNNANENYGNNMLYPISGLSGGDKITISFDWYYKDEGGIDNAFTKRKDKTPRITFNLGVNYNYGGTSFVTGSSSSDLYYKNFQISHTECKGHSVYTTSINTTPLDVTPDVVSIMYIQNAFVGTKEEHYFEISNLMINKGDKELPWTPAIEDVYGMVYEVTTPSYNRSAYKIMPGMCNELALNSMVSTLSCGFRQLATTNIIPQKYEFKWNAGASGTSLALPVGVKWVGGVTPTFEPLYTYKITIDGDFARCERVNMDVQERDDFSFEDSQMYLVDYIHKDYLYWQYIENGSQNYEYFYTKKFDLTKNEAKWFTGYTDSSLTNPLKTQGIIDEFNYSMNSKTLQSNLTGKTYTLLPHRKCICIKQHSGYISILYTFD